MKEKIIAKRYGDALIGLAKELDIVMQVIDEAKVFKSLYKELDTFQRFLKNPGITIPEKCELIDKAFSSFSVIFRQFVKFLIGKRRVVIMPDITDYIRIEYGRGEAIDAILLSAYPLTTPDLGRVKNLLEEKLKSKTNCYVGFDGELLGGLKVVVGNIVYDGSIKNRLKNLEKSLKSARVV